MSSVSEKITQLFDDDPVNLRAEKMLEEKQKFIKNLENEMKEMEQKISRIQSQIKPLQQQLNDKRQMVYQATMEVVSIKRSILYELLGKLNNMTHKEEFCELHRVLGKDSSKFNNIVNLIKVDEFITVEDKKRLIEYNTLCFHTGFCY